MASQRTSRDPQTLTPEMREKVALLRARAAAAGLRLQPLDAYRDPWHQARLFRQGHTRQKVNAKLTHLQARGYPELGQILADVGPQRTGATVTAAGPGESWHQFGQAWDACPWVGEQLAWEIDFPGAEAAWQQYGQLVKEAGLFWGGQWGDLPHCQWCPANSYPLEVLPVAEIQSWGRQHGWW